MRFCARVSCARLVVLASCSTAVGRISRTEGVENLARPFLASGVPAVVASLWKVEDQDTEDFFRQFYRNVGQSGDVAAALRATQVGAIQRLAGPARAPTFPGGNCRSVSVKGAGEDWKYSSRGACDYLPVAQLSCV